VRNTSGSAAAARGRIRVGSARCDVVAGVLAAVWGRDRPIGGCVGSGRIGASICRGIGAWGFTRARAGADGAVGALSAAVPARVPHAVEAGEAGVAAGQRRRRASQARRAREVTTRAGPGALNRCDVRDDAVTRITTGIGAQWCPRCVAARLLVHLAVAIVVEAVAHLDCARIARTCGARERSRQRKCEHRACRARGDTEVSNPRAHAAATSVYRAAECEARLATCTVGVEIDSYSSAKGTVALALNELARVAVFNYLTMCVRP
jgi:hypothetical protein